MTFVPVYSADTRELIKFKAVVYRDVSELCTHKQTLVVIHCMIVLHGNFLSCMQASFNISEGISVTVTTYNFSYSGTTTLTPSCVDSFCEYVVNVTSSLCSPLSTIVVALSALNRLGQGPPSNPTIIGNNVN